MRPLTARNAEGHLYARTARVQREIVAMLKLGPDGVLASVGSLTDETLVHLIRERRSARDWEAARRLSSVLLERCRSVLLSTLSSLQPEVREEAIRTVIEQLFERISALDDERGDFYEVRFGMALKRLTTSAFRRCVLTIAHHRRMEQDTSAELIDSRDAPFDPHQWPEDAVSFADGKKGLEAIKDERHRIAFTLYAMQEMPIESDDPEMATISRYFGVSSRTIRNWLDRAEADLAQWRRGKS